MCGIVGYVGDESAKPFLIEGLKRLEYRGYDSAGFALYDAKTRDFVIRRSVGHVEALVNSTVGVGEHEHQGIAHTRWATHGVPSEANAHPHRAGALVLVHNGIIENHAQIRNQLMDEGVSFSSQTDTEVFARLIEKNCLALASEKKIDFLSANSADKRDIALKALQKSASQVEGHYAVIFMVQGLDTHIFGLQAGAPLVTGHDKHSGLVASDLQAMLSRTQNLSFVPVGTLFEITKTDTNYYDVKSFEKKPVKLDTIEWSADKVAKEGFETFMLKEIFQQPGVIADTLSGRMPLSELGSFVWDNPVAHEALWKNVKKLYIVACGTAYHSALVAKYFFEKWAKLSVEVDIASEFRYRNPVLEVGTIVGVISQSGETADTLAALRLANERGLTTFSVCNVPGSTIMRESNFQYSTKAGPEIGVASTKAFTAQLTVLTALAYDVAHLRGMSPSSGGSEEGYRSLARLPQDIESVLAHAKEFQEVGASLEKMKTILFIGRGTMYPIALEGALKLKEITYRHAEGYAAGELKHGPIALVDKDLAAIVLAPRDELHAKTLSNLEEIRSRGAYIVGIGEDKDMEFRKLCNAYIALPKTTWTTAPVLYVIPTQLISYGLAIKLGCNIDKPRNLAKSVTVE
ncbi:MAG: glutamine--fructose-6-phosphate transaminase (isomerizing) [Bdellovibrionota bacterium]